MSTRVVITHPEQGETLSSGSYTFQGGCRPRDAQITVRVWHMNTSVMNPLVGTTTGSGGDWSVSLSLPASPYYSISAIASGGGNTDTDMIMAQGSMTFMVDGDGDAAANGQRSRLRTAAKGRSGASV